MISYDSNVLIYFLESHPQFGGVARDIIMSSTSKPVILSVLAYQEVLTGFALRDRNSLVVAREAIDSMYNVKFVSVSQRIATIAVELSAEYGKKLLGYDAIHIATAIDSGVDKFYTNDAQVASIGNIERLQIFPLI